jgi:myo-inositol-1(or 4)-monophosphatase
MTPTRSELVWEVKGESDFVSVVDRAAEEVIAAIVEERHPGVPLVGEEFSPGRELGDGLAFIVDPLDGTTNFLHGFPWYAVSIGVVKDGNPVAGAVLNVVSGELFSAVAGGGARRNGEPISVSAVEDPARSLIGTGFPFRSRNDIEPYLRVMRRLMHEAAGVRRPGAAALDLCDVACGRFDAFFELYLAPWDVAAGILILREAGGIATDLSGEPSVPAHGPIVSGNPHMHPWLRNLLLEEQFG